MLLTSHFKKKSLFSLFCLLIGGTCLGSACVQAASSPQQSTTVPKPPTLTAISPQELEALINQANQGDESAQLEVVKRYHWANFSDAYLRKVNIGSWNKIDEKAQKDYQYAYVLLMRNQLKKFPNVVKAIEANAIKGDPSFQNIMGNIFSQSAFSEGKWIAFEEHRKSAAQGFAPGQLNLALHYEEGAGVAKDDKKAFDLYAKAASQGYAEAEFHLGNMYFVGRGVTEDMKKAAQLMEKSAAQGYPPAQEFIGFLKEAGWNPNHQYKNSLEFTLSAAEKGNLYAQKTLGQRFYKGIGVKRDDKRAIEWWEKAANQGDKDSLTALGTYYISESDKPEDQKKALTLFQKAADLGDDNATAFLGIMYIRGLGAEKDEKKGVGILMAESEKGSILAEYFLELISGKK